MQGILPQEETADLPAAILSGETPMISWSSGVISSMRRSSKGMESSKTFHSASDAVLAGSGFIILCINGNAKFFVRSFRTAMMK